jgi:DNA primase
MVVKILLNYFYEPIEEGVTTGYFILKELGDVTFQTPIFATIVQEIIHLFEQDQSVTADHFIHHTNPEISKVAIRLFSNNYAVSENWEKFEIIIPTDKDIIDYISSRSVLRLKRVAVRHMIHELTLELKEEKNEEALMEKMKIIMELKKVSNIINERLGIVIG